MNEWQEFWAMFGPVLFITVAMIALTSAVAVRQRLEDRVEHHIVTFEEMAPIWEPSVYQEDPYKPRRVEKLNTGPVDLPVLTTGRAVLV